jgi:hypothetical protein
MKMIENDKRTLISQDKNIQKGVESLPPQAICSAYVLPLGWA